jgi:hypothetical protein
MKNGHGNEEVKNQKKVENRQPRTNLQQEKGGLRPMDAAEIFSLRIHGQNRFARQSDTQEKSMHI